MKKIILTIVLSSLLPAIAVAKDAEHKMRNSNPNPNASVMEGKHMQNNNPNPTASVMEGRHMMNDNPNASHPSKGNAGATKTSDSGKGRYSVVPYEK